MRWIRRQKRDLMLLDLLQRRSPSGKDLWCHKINRHSQPHASSGQELPSELALIKNDTSRELGAANTRFSAVAHDVADPAESEMDTMPRDFRESMSSPTCATNSVSALKSSSSSSCRLRPYQGSGCCASTGSVVPMEHGFNYRKSGSAKLNRA